jgi:hypothetical protein
MHLTNSVVHAVVDVRVTATELLRRPPRLLGNDALDGCRDDF